ncbi:MAG: hypothetical protein JWP89_1547 [Schlesneria sp.]|nr:hypothetical protein [Schlesneria sp.]
MTREEGYLLKPFRSAWSIKSADYKAENNDSKRIQVRAGEFRCMVKWAFGEVKSRREIAPIWKLPRPLPSL